MVADSEAFAFLFSFFNLFLCSVLSNLIRWAKAEIETMNEYHIKDNIRPMVKFVYATHTYAA